MTDSQQEGRDLTGDRRCGDGGFLAICDQASVSGTQPDLGPPGDSPDRQGQTLDPDPAEIAEATRGESSVSIACARSQAFDDRGLARRGALAPIPDGRNLQRISGAVSSRVRLTARIVDPGKRSLEPLSGSEFEGNKRSAWK
jgi:hypothetical protein